MSSDGKEKAQGVAVVDLLRPAGLFCFSMLVAKLACFYVFLFEFGIYIQSRKQILGGFCSAN